MNDDFLVGDSALEELSACVFRWEDCACAWNDCMTESLRATWGGGCASTMTQSSDLLSVVAAVAGCAVAPEM